MIRQRIVRAIVILTITAAITLLFGKLYTDSRVRTGEQLHPPVGQFVEVDGVRLHYVVRGDGPPIVFIHGMAGILQDFDFGVIDSLSKTNTCIAIDRIGAGYSDNLPLDSISLGTHTHYIHAAIKRLGIEKPLVVGHSYGGAVALTYALWYPDDLSGLVLLAPAAYPVYTRIAKAVYPLVWPAVSPLVSSLYLPIRTLIFPHFANNSAAPDTAPAEYVQLKQHIGIRPRNFLTQVRELDHLDENLANISSEYHRLALPVTIITGDADRILKPDSQAIRLARAIPQAKLVVIPGAGHLLPQSRATEIVPYIRAMADSTAVRKRD